MLTFSRSKKDLCGRKFRVHCVRNTVLAGNQSGSSVHTSSHTGSCTNVLHVRFLTLKATGIGYTD